MTLSITARAARMVIAFTRQYIEELGGDRLPAIIWIVGDTDPQTSVPRLSVGIAERKQVEGRFLKCEEFDCEIGHGLPDDILQRYQSYAIDLGDEGLLFVE